MKSSCFAHLSLNLTGITDVNMRVPVLDKRRVNITSFNVEITLMYSSHKQQVTGTAETFDFWDNHRSIG